MAKVIVHSEGAAPRTSPSAGVLESYELWARATSAPIPRKTTARAKVRPRATTDVEEVLFDRSMEERYRIKFV